MRILVADDAFDQRELLRLLLTRWGYEVVLAEDGLQAWKILESEPIRLVLSDWMMPGLDGPALCRKVRCRQSGPYVFVILITARDDKEDLIAGMNAGADDFLTKPYNFGELRARLRAAERILDLETELARKNDHLRAANAKLKQAMARVQADLDAAAAMQRSLLPQRSTSSTSLAVNWLFVPAATVAGDIFNFFTLGPRQIGFYLLDVAGHGVPSAMLSVTLSQTLSVDLRERCWTLHPDISPWPAPHKVVEDLNRRFQSEDSTYYFTIVFGYIDPVSGSGTLCQAGHPHPIIARRDGSTEMIGHGGFPVGLLEDVPYESIPFSLEAGDRIILYSDGITDCRNADGDPFGSAALDRLVRNAGDIDLDTLTARLSEQLHQWRGAAEIEDDMSLLALEKT